MKFTFACKKVALNDSIKEYAEKKISKLDRYFPEEADAFVTFAVEKKNRCVVELTIRAANGTLFRAQEEDPDGDMRGAIDEAVAFIDRRIRKNKTRLARNLRPDALTSNIPAEFDVVEEPEYHLVRTKRFAVKPMSTEEAILQMNLLDHSFYVFRSVETGNICVVYHRNNGGVMIIFLTPSSCCIFSIASDSSRSAAPSSTPGTIWQCTSNNSFIPYPSFCVLSSSHAYLDILL